MSVLRPHLIPSERKLLDRTELKIYENIDTYIGYFLWNFGENHSIVSELKFRKVLKIREEESKLCIRLMDSIRNLMSHLNTIYSAIKEQKRTKLMYFVQLTLLNISTRQIREWNMDS